MKTLKNSLVALILVATLSLTVDAAVPVTSQAAPQSAQNEVVKAIMVEGVLMPVVDLPQIEITANRMQGHMVKGTFRNGELVATYNLPQVEITAKGLWMRSTDVNIMADNQLPVIEIIAAFPSGSYLEASLITGSPMALVNLPEIIINGNLDGNATMALATIPAIPGIETQNGERFMLLDDELAKQLKDMPQSIYLMAKNCTRKVGEQLICEVSVMVRSNGGDINLSDYMKRLLIGSY